MRTVIAILVFLSSVFHSLAVTNVFSSATLRSANINAVTPLMSDDPSNYPLGMKLWLKADAGITVNGSGALSSWLDQSPNAYSASQATGTDQPIVVTNIYGNGNTVRFDGSSDFMSISTISLFTQTPGWTVMMAVRMRTVPTASPSMLSFSTHQEQFDVGVSTTNGFRVFNTSLSANGVNLGGALSNGLRVLTFVSSNSGPGGFHFHNNSVTTVNAGFAGAAYNIGFNRIGAYDVFATYAPVDISELIVWTNRCLTHIERGSLYTNYFVPKYRITKP